MKMATRAGRRLLLPFLLGVFFGNPLEVQRPIWYKILQAFGGFFVSRLTGFCGFMPGQQLSNAWSPEEDLVLDNDNSCI